MFIPTTRAEMDALRWDSLDIILVTGDSYIDHPNIGVSVIGHVLMDAGFKVGIIAQPDTGSDRDIARLGRPSLFWGVTGGSIDSMVANYTTAGRRRKSDDYTPGGINNARPDRAVIAYANLIRRFFKDTCPIVLGGVEASLRRIAHFDFWTETVRRSILFDAKADILVYGMGERAVIELAECLSVKQDYRAIKGICYIAGEKPVTCIELPAYEVVSKDNQAFIEMFLSFYQNSEYPSAGALCQRHADRYLVHNPPQPPVTGRDLDRVYEMDYERDQHPFYEQKGMVKALETIRFSLTTHRGCFGGCSFCSIAPHQGRMVSSRSAQSVIKEAEHLARHPLFKGIIADVGGPTANMYGMQCEKAGVKGMCRGSACLFPDVCENMNVDHGPQIALLKRLRHLPGVKRVFVASGIRHDLIMADTEHGESYLKELVMHHISGQMKIAPEHTRDHVLQCMGKPGAGTLVAFKDLFYQLNRAAGKRQFLTYYLIAAHPGCTLDDMKQLKTFASKELRTNPEQVQIFTPLPSTISGVMYYTQTDPFTGRALFVEKDRAKRQQQKDIIVAKKRIGKSRVRR
ncbi:MAG: YgiQ family radical SAM protein [Deltaproteobacteria bacterium]|nr:YgiQ family radical SAM protein [Deltaproteobacteria bacterium]